MTKNFRRLVKETLQEIIRNWHRVKLPEHFKPQAARRYKYQTRKLRYMRRKRREKPFAGPLEFTGKSKEHLTRMVRVTGTAKKAKGSMSAPRHFYMRKPNHPDKAAEATAVTPAEALKLARTLQSNVTKKLNKLKDREVYK